MKKAPPGSFCFWFLTSFIFAALCARSAETTKAGEWPSYDIIFHTPRKQADGTLAPGSFTVLHNAVLVQDHVPVEGPSTAAAPFKETGARGPLMLQDHGNPVRFRNIWLRKL